MASFRSSSARIADENEDAITAGVPEMNKVAATDPVGIPYAPTGGPAAAAAAAAVETVEAEKESRAKSKKGGAKGKPADDAVPYFSLFKYADRLDYVYMFFGTIGGICDGLLMPVSVIIVIQLVNAFVRIESDPEYERRRAKKFITGMMIYAPCIGLASFLEPACWMRTGERQALRIRALYLRAVLRQNEGFFDTRGASATEVVSGIAADTTALQEAISEKVGTFISFITAFLAGLGVALYFSWKLGLIWVAATPLMILPGIIYGKRLGSTAGAMGFATRQAGNVAMQALSSIHTVYSYVGENKVVKTYSENLQVVRAHGVRMGLFKSLAVGTTGLAYAVWALVLWVGSRMVINDGLKGTSVLNAGFIAVNGIQAVGYAFGLMKFFKDGCKAAHRVFEVIDREPEIDPWDEKGKVLKKIDGNLELQNIHFVYPARPNATIFSDFNLSIPAGTKIALVGGSGSGKSTVIALLERFYDPVKGRVLLDGVDIKELRLKWLRTQIGLVSQEPALFATTIGENIMMGQQDASIEEVVEAAKRSNAHKFIEEFPDGYKTQVGERGVKMSGGQKQRIAIARAILKNPAVLLLDEATSALDAESERVVQEALDSVSTGRTTVIVAHRLSTIKDADTIAVLKGTFPKQDFMKYLNMTRPMTNIDNVELIHEQCVRKKTSVSNVSGKTMRLGLSMFRQEAESKTSEGKIVEMGSHDELTAKDGSYASLVRLQQSRASEKATDDDMEAIPYKRTSSTNISGRASSLRKSLQIVGESPNSYGHADGVGKADDKIIVTKPSAPSFRKLLALNRPEWKQGVLGSIGACGFGTMYPLYSFLISSLMSGLYNPDPHHITVQVRKFCLIFVAMSIGAVTFSLMQHYNFAIMGESLTKRVRERLLSKFLTFEVGWYDDEQNSSGILSARLATEAAVVRALVSDRMSLLIQTGAAILFSATLSIALSYKLALVMIALQPLAIFSYAGKGQVLRHMYMASIKAQEDASQVASEAVSNHRTVTAFGVEEKIAGIFDDLQCSPRKIRMAQLRALVAGLGLGFANFAIVFLFAFSMWWANRLLQRGEISVSSLFKVFFIVIATGRMIGETGSVATDIARSATSIIKIFDILDRRTLIDADFKDAKKIEKVDGSVELRNVDFFYPTRPDIQVFKNLNLKVRAGRSMALVGRSGSGKSSVVALIERFYDPVKGVVYIDDRDIRTLSLKSLRMHIALVSQEPVLFAGTLRENIQYGRENATEAEIIEAAKSANAYNFICGLKDGFDTKAGDRGVQLSGGQKQRIAIARAIVKNPSILLLDEATSALDAESERVVQDALDKVMVGRTTIIVAHRLSTIKDCDCISVIKDGAVCEQGRHEELILRGAAYSELVKLQSGEEM